MGKPTLTPLPQRASTHSPRVIARHESAHAVVAVRLGVGLDYTDIRPALRTDYATHNETGERFSRTTATGGRTAMEQPSQWPASLPDAEWIARLTRMAAVAAAGIIAEEKGAG